MPFQGAATARGTRWFGAALAAAVALALPATGRAAPPPPVAKAKAGLAEAVAAGRIAPADAARYRGILARTAAALPRLGGSRAANLRGVLGDVAALSGSYTAPRALTLFAMLDWNTRWFGAQGPPAPQADTTAPDGVVYRYFPGHGLQFHPLADFAALNTLLARGDLDRARTLAEALRARAVRDGAAALWEYEWRFAGGRAPWTSGMAQAVAAQALARAGERLGDATLGELARAAYAAIPGRLDMQLAEGRWVRLYSFSRMAVFNAQLQTVVSLRDYASLTGDADATTLADALQASVPKALPRLDTGYWTRYAVGGAEESRGYHDFVVSLLGRLRVQTKDASWADLATRFKAYETQPPSFQVAAPAAPVTAAAKGKATFTFSFWLSKRSSVSIAAGGERRRLTMTYGWHRLTWWLPRGRAGVFPVSVEAAPVAGPRAAVDLLPLVVLARAPAVGELSVAGGAVGAPPGGSGSGLVVGAAENAVLSADAATAAGQLALATGAGLRAVRISLPWSPGQTAPDPALAAQLATTAQQAAAAGVRLFLEVYPASPAVVPLDDARRGEFAAFVRQLAVSLPQVRDFVIGSQVNDPAFWPQSASTPGAYLALLAAAYDTLKAVDPATRVIGGALDAQAAPGTFVLSLGQAYRRSGRTTPVMDALAIQPTPAVSSEPADAVHPSGPTTIGDYARLVANLKRAFDRTAQPGATLPIVYDGYAVQTAVPPEKAALYGGTETDAVPEPAQAAAYARALELAACQPNVTALLFGRVVDERDLGGSQSGLYYADGTPKSSLAAVLAAVGGLQGRTLASCPGAKPQPQPASPPAVTFAPDGRSARIDCPRACSYVAVLQRGGVPVRARAAAADAGASVTVAVPSAGVAAGDVLAVRVASQPNPSDAVAEEGTGLTVG